MGERIAQEQPDIFCTVGVVHCARHVMVDLPTVASSPGQHS